MQQIFGLLRTVSFWHLLEINYTKFSVGFSLYLYICLLHFLYVFDANYDIVNQAKEQRLLKVSVLCGWLP
jgi:hypothetical protein